MLFIYTFSLPGMIKETSTKKHLIVNHGGRLYIRTYMGHVDHWHNFSKNGLKPSIDIANFKFQGSTAKSSHFSSTWCTNPSKLLFVECHCNNFDIVVDLYICFSWGIMGKWHSTFTGTWVLHICLYLTFPHFGRWVCSMYRPLYKIHLEIHACMFL
jgi:hypothetical protein